MKKFTKTLISLSSLGLLVSSAVLCGCSSPMASDGGFSFAEAAQPVETDSEGYAIWRMGKNDLGNGAVIDLEGFSEKEFRSSDNPPLLLEALSTNTGPLSAEFDEEFGRINDNTSVYCKRHLGKEYVSEEKIEKGVIESHIKQCHSFIGPANEKDEYKRTATIAQVKCSSPDLITQRLKQAQTEKWDIAEQLSDCVWKFQEEDYTLRLPEGKEPCVDDVWYVIYTDGMITVLKYQTSKYGSNVSLSILSY